MLSLIKQRNKRRVTERLIKESLLCQLSYTVKEVQLLFSQRGDVFISNEACNSLIVVLESIFLHGLKKGIISRALKSVSSEENRPQPTFWNVVCNYTHKDTLESINNLTQITTDVGRCRVWIRMALNQTELTSYFQAFERDSRHIDFSYGNNAFLKDRETCDTACKLLEGIVNIQFQVPTNSSILNQWSNEPLMLSGIWSPPMKTPVSHGVDVAEGLGNADGYDDDDDDDTSSIRTSSSMTTLSTIFAIDEDQVLKMILDTPVRKTEKEIYSQTLGFEASTSKGVCHDLVIPEEEEENLTHEDYEKKYVNEENNANENDLTHIGNSLVNTSGWSSSGEKDIIEPQSYSSAFEVNEGSIKDTKYYQNLLIQSFSQETKQEEDEGEESSDYEMLSDNRQWEEDENLFKIAQEAGLQGQNYTCHNCQLSIGLNFAEARLCYLTGKYYCENCHQNEQSIIPSRLLYNWDHKKYSVSCKASKYLSEIINKPFIDITKTNPKLYGAVEEIREISKIRLQLSLLRPYLYTCHTSVNRELQTKLWPREYIYECCHVYALSDLCKIPGGILAAELNAIVVFAKQHVLNCWLCSQKGFICEMCKNQKVIYPFDLSTHHCRECHALYHKSCFVAVKNCPKCKRHKERATFIALQGFTDIN